MANELIPLYNQMIQRGGGALIPKGTEVIPRVTSAARSMRNVTPVARAIPRIGMNATTAAGLSSGAARKMAGGVLVAKTAYDLARLGLSEDARQQAAQDVEDSAMNDGALVRAAKGFVDPVNTAYGIGSMVGDLVGSMADARKARESLARGREEATPEMTAKRKKVQADIAANKAKKAAEENSKMSFQDATEARLASLDEGGGNDEMYAMQRANRLAANEANMQMNAAAQERAAVAATPTTSAAPSAEQPSKAQPVFDQALVESLFETTHGTSFDPKSAMDRRKKIQIESMLEEMGGLGNMTPNQFALQLYRRS